MINLYIGYITNSMECKISDNYSTCQSMDSIGLVFSQIQQQYNTPAKAKKYFSRLGEGSFFTISIESFFKNNNNAVSTAVLALYRGSGKWELVGNAETKNGGEDPDKEKRNADDILDDQRRDEAEKFFSSADLGVVIDADGWEHCSGAHFYSRIIYIEQDQDDYDDPPSRAARLVVFFQKNSPDIDHATLDGEDVTAIYEGS